MITEGASEAEFHEGSRVRDARRRPPGIYDDGARRGAAPKYFPALPRDDGFEDVAVASRPCVDFGRLAGGRFRLRYRAALFARAPRCLFKLATIFRSPRDATQDSCCSPQGQTW